MSTAPAPDRFTFLHAADVHLDSPLKGLERYEGAPVDAIRGATRAAFVNLVDLAIDDASAFVIIAGDLYDGDWKDYNTGLFFAAQMARLERAGIPVFVAAGNHDAESQITRRLRLPSNVHLFPTGAAETRFAPGLPVAIHGQGFAVRDVSEDLSRNYPRAAPGRFNIGVLHTALTGREGHASYAPATVDGLRALGYDYWALGHVHRREVVTEAPWIVFPGNLQGRHARETGPKGASRVTVSDGAVEAVEHVELDVVRWFDQAVDLSGTTDLEGAIGRVESALRGAAAGADGRLAAVRLTLGGACTVHAALRAGRERVVAECRALANAFPGTVWIEKVRIATRPERSFDDALARDDAFGGLLRAIDALDASEEALAQAAALFVDLRGKLPPELLSGEDGFDPTSPQTLRDSLDDVKAMLIERLLAGEDP